ncbi:hypothetical protein [Paraburkholderia sp. J67]|uniref:hypothetical protein n=1 Tax=Paraburkholderia sp. J67 TaxID=2805435 RepID=UPI002ABE5F66|nr:hypothetical protein [Paraburkholderia sp. J67]
MKTSYITANKIAILVGIAFSLVGCSSKPSEGDVRKGVIANLGIDDCDLFKLAKFEKVNGLKEDDSHYQMEMSGEIIMKPLSANKDFIEDTESYLEKNKDASTQAQSDLNDLAKKIEAGEQELGQSQDPEIRAAIVKGIMQVDPAIRGIVGAVDAQNVGLAEIYYKAHPDELEEATKDFKTVTDYREHQLTEASMRNVIFKNIAKECPNVSAALVRTFTGANVSTDQFKDDLPYDFTFTYNMQLTDNGWQIAQ